MQWRSPLESKCYGDKGKIEQDKEISAGVRQVVVLKRVGLQEGEI